MSALKRRRGGGLREPKKPGLEIIKAVRFSNPEASVLQYIEALKKILLELLSQERICTLFPPVEQMFWGSFIRFYAQS